MPADARSAARVGIVVIGRNEGGRLAECLQSLADFEGPVLYVDSGSVDRSVAIAEEHGVQVLALDPARPFSAARARNEGLELLRTAYPSLRFAQFLDGDCTLSAGWIRSACAAMEDEPRRAVVIGHLQERHVEASLYNRLCALEWKSPPGDLSNFGGLGGIMLVRVSVFAMLGGFNPSVIAGEDSEFGVRVAAAGYTVTKIDAPMATHDADIHRFEQWWRRSVRSGHAIGQRSYLNGRGPARDCMRERRSTLLWGLWLPVAALGLAAPTRGLSVLLLAAYAVLAWRVFRYRRRHGDSPADARLYAGFNVLGKLAEAFGLGKFFWNRAVGRYHIIEYK